MHKASIALFPLAVFPLILTGCQLEMVQPADFDDEEDAVNHARRRSLPFAVINADTDAEVIELDSTG